MDARKLSVGIVSLALLAGAGAWAYARPADQPAPKAPEKAGEESEEEVIEFAKAPEAVRTAALKLVGVDGEKAIKKVIKEEDEDVYTYEIEYIADGVECAAIFSTAGDLMESEKATTEAKLPAAVMAALKKDYPKATFAKPFAVTKMFYEIEVVSNGKTHEVRVDAAGNIEDGSKDNDKDEGKAERVKGDAGDDGFRKVYAADKADLGPNGVNAFFDLTPGTVHTYQDGKDTLTITVLNESRVVDGVTTRVIEEREVADGKPKETSRNFFAIDRTNSDVYYFGEEVDVFDADGKVTHPGAWMSGVNGAKFGLMMPGTPKLGDKFYQELAPSVAMDRFEIVSMDEAFETPAGKFEHVIHVRETTPLENDVGHKWYARGVGLIKDGSSVLASHTRVKK